MSDLGEWAVTAWCWNGGALGVPNLSGESPDPSESPKAARGGAVSPYGDSMFYLGSILFLACAILVVFAFYKQRSQRGRFDD